MATIPPQHASQPTCLYRLFGADDELLYIGISTHALSRLGTHLADKDWSHRVATVKIEWHPTREAASAAEVAAIKAEHPRYNILHNDESRLGLMFLRGDSDHWLCQAAMERMWARTAAEEDRRRALRKQYDELKARAAAQNALTEAPW